MNKSILNILGIGILVIIIISVVLTFTGVIPGRLGDLIILGSSIVIALIMFYFIRIKKKNSLIRKDS